MKYGVTLYTNLPLIGTTMEARLKEILASAPEICKRLSSMNEILLSSLVMTGETPAPTFSEQERVRILLDRFRECGLDNISSDEADNGCAILTGSEGDRSVLLVAHVDTLYPASVDHTITLSTDSVSGAGVADNSLGVAVLGSLPTLLEKLDIQFKSNLILVGAAGGLGRGNLRGLNFFLENYPSDISAGICIEGVQLGRLSFSSVGMLRGEIKIHLDDEEDIQETGYGGAVGLMGDIVNRISAIPIPQKPKTRVILGSCNAGKGFSTVPRQGSLRFEVRSENQEIVSTIENEINEIVEEAESLTGAKVAVEIVSRREPGGITFRHPLTKAVREIMASLEIEPEIEPSVSELSALIAKNIPGVTLGLTELIDEGDESTEVVAIEPMAAGLAQLIVLLQAIDEGLLNGKKR
ncbi:MAG: tripeptide aminopeptidase [Limisphaerales bacterium]